MTRKALLPSDVGYVEPWIIARSMCVNEARVRQWAQRAQAERRYVAGQVLYRYHDILGHPATHRYLTSAHPLSQ